MLRDGSSVITLEARETNKTEVIKHMVGREIADLFPRHPAKPGAPVLEVENVNVTNPHTGERFLFDISLSLRAGEVLGIGGLMGAGRTELLDAPLWRSGANARAARSGSMVASCGGASLTRLFVAAWCW